MPDNRFRGLFRAWLVMVLIVAFSVPALQPAAVISAKNSEPVQAASGPNLVPYTPDGWLRPIVAAMVTGTHMTTALYATQPTYIDWAVSNVGDAAAPAFHTCLYLDGAQIGGAASAGLAATTSATELDLSQTLPAPGTHSLRLVVDCNNEVLEVNEADNAFEWSFTWQPVGGAECYASAPGLAATRGDALPESSAPLPAGGAAVPPSPDLIERLKEQGYSSATIMDMTRTPVQIDIPNDQVGAQVGTRKALVLLVAFPDKKLNPVSQPSLYNNLLFSDGMYPTPGSMRDFYQANSYNQFDVQGNTANCVVALHPSDYYAKNDGVHNKGFGPYPNNAQGLVEEVVKAADAFVNFAEYATAGKVTDLFIVHAGRGAETDYPSDLIWSHQGFLSDSVIVDGVEVSKYSIEPEYAYNAGDSTMGIFAHEYGHVLGLPDLYDTGDPSDSYGVGTWSLMAGGSWNGNNGSSPANLDAWSKIRLGWATPIVPIPNLTEVTLPPSSSFPVIYKLPLAGGPNEYFLLENRQPLGFDAALRGSGLLIWHIDENGWSNRLQCTQNNNWLCDGHYKVALEQADGLYELERNYNSGNDGDPFPGSTGNRTFDFTTTPNSSSYDSAVDTQIRVTQITASDANMVANLSVPAIPAVANDYFGSPSVIAHMPYTQTQNVAWATTASDEPAFPCAYTPSTQTVWYRYTPAASGSLTLDTYGSNYNTVLGVWTGYPGNLTPLGCSDDAPGSIQSAVQVQATVGTVYMIGVGTNPSQGLRAEIKTSAYSFPGAAQSLVLNASFEPFKRLLFPVVFR
jgi:immune inhibitor A